RLVQKIPIFGKHLTIGHSGTPYQHKEINRFKITKDTNHKPHSMMTDSTMGQNANIHLLPIPHSQQTSPNGCVDACLDMIGCYYDCDDLQAKVKIRSDGLRRMPETKRPVMRGMRDNEFETRLKKAGLLSHPIKEDKSAIKKALKAGPIMASVKFAYGFFTHSVMIVGYHGDKVIINDPWHGGHLTKSMDWLLKNLNDMKGAPLLVFTRNQERSTQVG
ncbi:MAG: papain-like cysteine protease family protein, partial [Endozoicomonas sp.]